jgi:hypothetical protein
MKFASVVYRLKFPRPPAARRPGLTEPGDVVIGRVLKVNPHYAAMELADATRVELAPGDVVVGALGSRQALRGFSGYAPAKLSRGETISILNLGGVMGRHIGEHVTLGEPTQVEVLGVAGRNVREGALEPKEPPPTLPPIVLVAGTCMNVGKTCATAAILRHAAPLRVGAAKLTGIAALKDLLHFKMSGATAALSFLDAGWASSVDMTDPAGVARRLAAHLTDNDLIVMELGDGLLGHYHVEKVLADPWMRAHTRGVVLAASDLVAAKGAIELLHPYRVAVVTGPVTDGIAGVSYIRSAFGLPAVNALQSGPALFETLAAQLSLATTAPVARR